VGRPKFDLQNAKRISQCQALACNEVMSSNPLKAQYARVRAAEDRHAEKLKAKAAKSGAGASSSSARQPSYTKTVVSNADKAAARRAALAEQETPTASVRVRKDDGSTLPMAKALYLVQSFLKERKNHAEAALDEIHLATGIDVGVAANAKLEEVLRDSEHVEPVEAAGMGLRLRYRPKHGVRDAAMLAALLSRAVVEGVPRSELLEVQRQLTHRMARGVASRPNHNKLVQLNPVSNAGRVHPETRLL